MVKRLFIGIEVEPSERLLSIYNELTKQFKNEKIKWVKIENIHITLKFLGETESKLIPEIKKRIERTTKNLKRFQTQIKGIGRFSQNCKTTVIWLGLEKTQMLGKLANEIINSMHEIGFPLEKRAYNPHLTFGRVKHLNNEMKIKKYIDLYKEIYFQDIDINTVTLFESVLSSDGPVYEIIDGYSLL